MSQPGPHLVSALLCRECTKKGGQLTIHDAGVSFRVAPTKDATPELSLGLFLCFAGTPLTGSHEVTLIFVTPTGQHVTRQPYARTFSPDSQELLWVFPPRVFVPYDGDGLYVMEVSLDGQMVTRVPFHLTILPTPTLDVGATH